LLFEAKKVCIGIQAIGMKIDDVNRKTISEIIKDGRFDGRFKHLILSYSEETLSYFAMKN